MVGHFVKDCTSKEVACWRCGEFGHKRDDCP